MTTNIIKLTFGSGETYQFTSTDPTCILEINGKAMVGLQHVEDHGICVGIYPDQETFRTLEVLSLVPGKKAEDMSFEELMTASSLGSPEAFQLRLSQTPEEKASIDNAVEKIRQRWVDKEIAVVQGETRTSAQPFPEPFAAQTDEEAAMVDRLADDSEDFESMKRYGPFTGDEVLQLERFQDYGTFHPFTCPNNHGVHRTVALWVEEDGLFCPVQQCDYRQDWCWLAMLDAKNLLPTRWSDPRALGCLCELDRSENGWQVTSWNSDCPMHKQLEGTEYDKTTEGKHTGIRPMHVEGAAEHNEELITAAEFDKAMDAWAPVDVVVELDRTKE